MTPHRRSLKLDTVGEDPKLDALQRKLTELHIPVILLFEGMEAAGIGSIINRLLLSLDPRGFKVYYSHSATEETLYRPFLWRFWLETPEKGRIGIFDRSWYSPVLQDHVEGKLTGERRTRLFREINQFERQLTDDGVLLIKIYLSVGRKFQRRRFQRLVSNPATSWRITKINWKYHTQYDQYADAAKDVLEHTGSKNAPWNRIKSNKLKKAFRHVRKLVCQRMREAIKAKKRAPDPKISPRLDWRKNALESSRLDQLDLSLSLDPQTYRQKRRVLQRRLHELEHEIYLRRIPVVLAFEGWDAAGKGGAIRRLAKGLDPRGYEVIPVGAPTRLESNHHYLWRFWKVFPKGGHIAVYDRSWYGRVMVERLEGFCSEKEWQRAYREINETEEQWANFGTVILKFWLHIDRNEQMRRFQAREINPDKNWKITAEDWRNRDRWHDYWVAVEDMIQLTDTPFAPWILVEGNNKPYARIKVMESVAEALEARL